MKTIIKIGLLAGMLAAGVGAALTYNTVKWTNSNAGVTTAILADAGGNAASPAMAASAGVFSSAAGTIASSDDFTCPLQSYTYYCQVAQPISTVSSGWIVPLTSADGINFATVDVTNGGQHYTPDAGWANAAQAAAYSTYLSVTVPAGQPGNLCSLGIGMSYNDAGSITCQMTPFRSNSQTE